jgi:ketosteroid isomerase-like protein
LTGERREFLQSVFDQWNAGSREIPEGTHPDFVLHSALTGLTYEGHEGVRRWMAEIDDQFDSWQLRIDEFRDVGEDWLMGLGGVSLRGRASGIELDQATGWLVRFADGESVEMRLYSDHQQAIDAAGAIEGAASGEGGGRS